MDKMSPPERFHAVLMGEKPDRVPVNPFILGFSARIMGMPLGDFYADGNKCFEAQFMCMRLYGYESTPMYGYASCGPWEFGGKIGFPYGEGHSAPYVIEHPVMEIGDIDKLEVPDSDKPVGGYVEAQKVCDRCVEMGMPAIFQGGSVFTAAAVVADTSKFLKWTRTEPKAAHELLDKVCQMYMNQIEYLANRYGPEKCVVFDGGPVEANTVISPQKFEEFAFPYMMKVHKKIRELDIPVTLMHPCADQNLNIPYYIKLRESFNWKGIYAWIFGPETPLKTQIEKFGSHDIIGGNVDPPSIQTKSYQEVVQLCKENIEQGMDNPRGFILCPGCEFPPLAEPIKPMAFLDAARQFGVYK